MNEALEDAWKEFERTGEIANSADELLGYATRLTEENAKLREALLGLLRCKGIITSDKECVINAKNLLKEQSNDK